MAMFRGDRTAFGWPGAEPRWTQGNKDGVGTAYSPASRVWFSLCQGALSEVYYPTVDRAQLRDLQFLVTDGRTFCDQEKEHLHHQMEPIAEHTLGYRVVSTDPLGRYQLVKEIIADPFLPVVLQQTEFMILDESAGPLQLYAYTSPRLDCGGWGNNGYVVEVAGRELLVAERNGLWLAVGATLPFRQMSVGYVGRSDGLTDLTDNYQLDLTFDRALEGHIGLIGELDLTQSHEFTLGLAFGDSLQAAVVTLFQALAYPFSHRRHLFLRQWRECYASALALEEHACDGGRLYRRSHALLRAHEDKTFPGALIASLSIPWGHALGDDAAGGYHLVWTRDMVNSTMGLLAGGDLEAPFRALIYLAGSQRSDGGFPQNFWINGEPHWHGVQLDEVAFPILLAWRLHQERALRDFDPYPMVLRAAAFLINHGPATQQERWEENGGYSPSTLAVNIAALICAASLARARQEHETAAFLESYADFLETHLESWTVTTEGSLGPAIPRHYIRIHPVDIYDPVAAENPNHGTVLIANRPPGAQQGWPAKDVVDAGFLELVRYGIRRPDDPLIVDSLKVVDQVLRKETPYGPAWYRYNHDGYGQKPDGTAYTGWGQGRPWPLLTGERAHYELAAGHDITPYIEALERFATETGMLPEQIWDEPHRPDLGLYLGRPTGAAMPLCWAHAEYIKLLRSRADGVVFDRIQPVYQRYCQDRSAIRPLEVWKANRQPRQMAPGSRLRVQANKPFRLRWTMAEWQTITDTDSISTPLGIDYIDLEVPPDQSVPVRFTFHWIRQDRWEGRDYAVAMAGAPAVIAPSHR